MNESAAWRTLWTAADAGLAVLAADGTITRANPALCRLLEFSEAELLRKRIEDLTHPADRDPQGEELSRVISSGEGLRTSRRLLTRRDMIVWVSFRADPVSDGGEVILSQIYPIPNGVAPIPPSIESGAILRFLRREWKWSLSVIAGFLLLAASEISARAALNSRIDTLEREVRYVVSLLKGGDRR